MQKIIAIISAIIYYANLGCHHEQVLPEENLFSQFPDYSLKDGFMGDALGKGKEPLFTQFTITSKH